MRNPHFLALFYHGREMKHYLQWNVLYCNLNTLLKLRMIAERVCSYALFFENPNESLELLGLMKGRFTACQSAFTSVNHVISNSIQHAFIISKIHLRAKAQCSVYFKNRHVSILRLCVSYLHFLLKYVYVTFMCMFLNVYY